MLLARALRRHALSRPRITSAAAAATVTATATAAISDRPTSACEGTAATGSATSDDIDNPPPCLRIEVPSTDALNAYGGCISRWAQSQPQAVKQLTLASGCYRVALADTDVVRCVERTEPHNGALQRAYDAHALVYWPSATTPSTAMGSSYEYGVVFVPGTGAGVGPAYRHRPARNKYPGPIDVLTFHPEHEAFFPTTARAFVTQGVPTVQLTWSDFRGPGASDAERAYGYDGGSKTNPAVPTHISDANEPTGETFVDSMGDVASAKVEAAVKLLLLNGCGTVVLAGHSMGAAICCETARRLLASESRAAGVLRDTKTTREGQRSDSNSIESWRQPTQLRALCMLSGAAIHWTLGSWRTLAHRVLANEGTGAQSLLEQHEIPLLIVNAEHDIGCAKGVYWEAVDGEDGTVEPQGMFAQTAHDYFIIEDHTHSWFRGTESSKPSNVADEKTWSEAERLAVDCDGREIYDVGPTISTLSSLLRRWVSKHDRTAWSVRHGRDIRETNEQYQAPLGTWVSVDSSADRSSKHNARRPRL